VVTVRQLLLVYPACFDPDGIRGFAVLGGCGQARFFTKKDCGRTSFGVNYRPILNPKGLSHKLFSFFNIGVCYESKF
jgi:hypothetical protein